LENGLQFDSGSDVDVQVHAACQGVGLDALGGLVHERDPPVIGHARIIGWSAARVTPIHRILGAPHRGGGRAACNHRLVDACYLWAFAALTASRGGATTPRARTATHHQALRALGNRLVGIVHGCLAYPMAHQETVALPAAEPAA
jgi:hypothetical protein